MGDVRDGEAVDGRERWRRSRRTQLMVLMIKELTQQAQATTASKRSTRGVAQAMAIVKAPPSPSPRPTALTTTSSSTTTPPSAPRTWCPGPGAREAVITFPAESSSQAITPSAPSPRFWAFFTVWRSCPPPPGEDDLTGVTEAAGALEVTPQAVRERLAAGTLPGRKIGRNWVLPASALHR